MKKVISIFVLSLFISFGSKAANTKPALNNGGIKKITLKSSTSEKPDDLVCWISEIIYHSDGSIDISYRCKEVVIEPNWVKLFNNKLHTGKKRV